MNSRTECSPRIIRRINIKEKADDALKYGFYRQINHLSIIRLDNETGIIDRNTINKECILNIFYMYNMIYSRQNELFFVVNSIRY